MVRWTRAEIVRPPKFLEAKLIFKLKPTREALSFAATYDRRAAKPEEIRRSRLAAFIEAERAKAIHPLFPRPGVRLAARRLRLAASPEESPDPDLRGISLMEVARGLTGSEAVILQGKEPVKDGQKVRAVPAKQY